MVDVTGTTTWTYNDADEVTQIAQPNGTISYEWRDNGQPKKRTEPGSITVTFGYDSYGRPTTTTRADSSWNDTTTIAYDSYGRPLTKTLDNTTKEHYEYDSLSRLNKVMVKNSAGTTTLRSQNWVYDGVGNMTSRTIEGVTTTYSYDNIHQLITESRSGLLLEYTYDANGNRLSKTLNSGTPSTYTYADDDRLLTTPHGTITYDAAGRPTAYPTASGTKYFSWDYDDRLLGYSNTSGGTYVEAHKYNGAGARVEFSSGGTTRKDLRTGIGVTAPVVSSAVGGSTTVSYLPGIAEKRGSTKSYQHSGLKNVDAQSNASAAISATREYDAFGGVITGSGTTGTFNGPFGHAGDFGYQSEGSGLQLLGHRWYDPEVGRFLTPDPIQDGKNWFAYCDNNPLGRVDPAGLFYWPSLPDTDVRNDTGKPIVIIWDGADGNTYEGTLSAGNWLDNGIDYDWYLAGFTKDGRPIWRKLRQSCTNILTKNKDGSVGVELTFTTFFGGLAEAVYHGPGSSEYIGSGSKDGGKYYPPGFNGNRRPKPGGGLGKKPSGGSGVSLPPPSQTRNGWHPTGGQRYE